MTSSIYVVIMAGGSGTRFWPFSRDKKPKQFLDVLDIGKSLLQMTFDRFKEVTTADKIWIVSNEKYGVLIREQLPEIKDHQVLLEPEKKNTAPCIAYAAYKIQKEDPNAVLVVSPADHLIFNEGAFKRVVETAVNAAEEEDKLVTIGIKPSRPETGYGYIQYEENQETVKKVKRFTEKPATEVAEQFLKSGDFLWNSGIFIWKTHAIIQSFERHQKVLAHLFQSGQEAYFTEAEAAFVQKAYHECENISIDYAIMEKANNVFVVPGDFGWSDLGSWNALHEIKDKDDHDNVVEANALLYDATNNYIKAKKEKVVVVQGVDNLLIADFDDVLLITQKEDSSVFKSFISDVQSEKGESFI